MGVIEGKADLREGLSEQHLLDCNTMADGCKGAIMIHSYNFVSKNGVLKEKHYPYRGVQGQCREK